MIDADKRKAVFLLHQEGIGRNQIARQLRISRNTVRVIIDQQGEMPLRTRSDKIQIDRDLLKRLYYEECEGFAQRVHDKLAKEEHIAVKYSTLTRILRQLGLRRSGEPRCGRAADAVREWILDLINGKRAVECLHVEIPDADVQFLYFHLKHGRSRQRKKAATILARERGVPNSVIAKAIQSACSSIRQRIYRGEVDSPKTKNSVRRVALPKGLAEEIETWRRLSAYTSANAWVFPSKNLGPLPRTTCGGDSSRRSSRMPASVG